MLDNCHKISFKSEDLRFEPASPNELQKKPAAKDLVFGKHFTDHWLRIPWSQSKGWEEPVICKLENMNLHPGAKVLHYAQELFEGMKAYRGIDDEIRYSHSCLFTFHQLFVYDYFRIFLQTVPSYA